MQGDPCGRLACWDRLAFIKWDEFYVHWAGVVGFGTDQAVVADLLENMGGPAGCAAHGEGGREKVTGQADRGQQGGRIEFYVGVEAAARLLFLQDGQRQLFDAACQDKFLWVGK